MEIASVAWSPNDGQLAFLGNDFPRGFASHNHLWLVGASGSAPTRLDDLDRSLQNGLNSDVRLGGVNSDPKWVGDRLYHLVAEGGSVHLRALHVRDRKAETIVGGNRSVEAFQANAKGIVFTAMAIAAPAELYALRGDVRQLTEFNGETRKKAEIRGHYGERDYLDLMEAVDFASSKYPFVDSKRLAVAGGSYGGFMTNWVVTQTDRFKAAVTDRSISSWWTFWGTSDIGPSFGRDQIGADPWDDEEAALAKSPLRHVKNVTTPLLLVHSLEDLRCWHVETIQFFTALRYYGKEAEMVLFPKENHDLSRGGKPKHRVARLHAYLRWFDTHLS